MKIIDNSTAILGDELRLNIGRSSKLRIAASCFSIYAWAALKAELNKVDSVQFIFTTPTFVPSEVTEPGLNNRLHAIGNFFHHLS